MNPVLHFSMGDQESFSTLYLTRQITIFNLSPAVCYFAVGRHGLPSAGNADITLTPWSALTKSIPGATEFAINVLIATNPYTITPDVTVELLDSPQPAAIAQLNADLTPFTPILNTISNYLAADIQIAKTANWSDGPALTLGAGTWLLMGHLLIHLGAATTQSCAFRLWDGTTAFAEGQTPQERNENRYFPVDLQAIVAPAGTTTYKMQASVDVVSAADSLMKAANNLQSSGNFASYLHAIKLG